MSRECLYPRHCRCSVVVAHFFRPHGMFRGLRPWPVSGLTNFGGLWSWDFTDRTHGVVGDLWPWVIRVRSHGRVGFLLSRQVKDRTNGTLCALWPWQISVWHNGTLGDLSSWDVMFRPHSSFGALWPWHVSVRPHGMSVFCDHGTSLSGRTACWYSADMGCHVLARRHCRWSVAWHVTVRTHGTSVICYHGTSLSGPTLLSVDYGHRTSRHCKLSVAMGRVGPAPLHCW